MEIISQCLARRKHIFNDLQPYVCTAVIPQNDTCLLAFGSRTAWIKHETTNLESGFQQLKCPFCPLEKPARPARTHLKHLSRHLREVALAVLPQSRESDSESDVESTSSKQTLSDISSLHALELELPPASPTDSHPSPSNEAANAAPETADMDMNNEDEIPGVESDTSPTAASGAPNTHEKTSPAEQTKFSNSEHIHEQKAPVNNQDVVQDLGPNSISARDHMNLDQAGFEKDISAGKVEDAKPTEPKVAALENDSSKLKLQPCLYKTGKMLGADRYSIIKECVHIETGRYYAAKVINKRLMSGKEHMVSIDIIRRQAVHGSVCICPRFFRHFRLRCSRCCSVHSADILYLGTQPGRCTKENLHGPQQPTRIS